MEPGHLPLPERAELVILGEPSHQRIVAGQDRDIRVVDQFAPCLALVGVEHAKALALGKAGEPVQGHMKLHAVVGDALGDGATAIHHPLGPTVAVCLHVVSQERGPLARLAGSALLLGDLQLQAIGQEYPDSAMTPRASSLLPMMPMTKSSA